MSLVVQTTDGVAPAQRAGHWASVIAETYFPLSLVFRDPAHFQGSLERRTVGAVSISHLQTEPMQYERRPNHISHAREEEYLITIPRRSPVEFRQLGREVRCDPGGFILERGDEPYRFSYGAPNELCVLKVPRRVLGERVRNPDRLCAKVFDGRSGPGGLFVKMAQLVQESPDASGGRAGEVLGRQLIELASLALDSQADVDEGVRSSVRAAHLRRAEEIIRKNLSNAALSPDMVAEACGISKRYLHELFAEANRTVSQYIREQRLIAARDLLQTSPGGSLAEVAYRFGFSDQAQFSRLFRAMFDTTPSAFRLEASRRG